MSLYELERDVLIPLGDSRIHFAIVCASASCPPLRSEAYLAARLNRQLDDQARVFLNDSKKNRFQPSRRHAQLSKIFDWFEDEFEQRAGSVANYVARYVTDESLAQALRSEQFSIEHLDYDWSLNGVSSEVVAPANQ